MTSVPLLAMCLERLSAVCSLFLCRGGTIVCKLTGSRRTSVDLLLIAGRAVPLLAEEIVDDGMSLASAPWGLAVSQPHSLC